MKKMSRLEVFELITILILFGVIITISSNSVVNKCNISQDSITYLSNNDKKYIAKYIDNETNSCDLSEAVSILTNTNNSNNMYLKMYPIGSIYISIDSTNPGTKFGGTWVEFGSGRTLVGVDTTQTEFNAVEKTGGEKTHTLSVSEMPSHGNHLYLHDNNTLTGKGNATSKYLSVDTMASYGSSGRGWDAVASNEMYPAGQALGGGAAHNNLQPYITVYMWKRTA